MKKIKTHIKTLVRNIFWYFYCPLIINKVSKKLPSNINHILFVCKGNICRSALAEALGKSLAKNRGFKNISFQSGGLEVNSKNPAVTNTIKIASENNLDLSNHLSQSLSQQLIEQSDILFVMEYKHLNQIKNKFENANGKTFLLPFFCKSIRWGYKKLNIEDPYGGEIEKFRHCYNHIEQSLKGFLERLSTIK